ncbi:putative glutaminase [Aspergillus mulundensis]|uniref:Glutaminase n=1 Tax=Aspergillus mulundensis TaxID=1810919 RepID=A0A3D8SJ25_9EURO|nr:hypothetical protein DSM5745_02981 [Aspergillus mulundensis]RDW86339.1 hypothetical protein DSM5745_02981 [Aspergillus mulundensis]
MRPSLAVLAAALQATVGAASSLTPPVLPLIVRNPYLSTWLGNARDVPWSTWPMFYTGQELGLGLLAQIPSTDTVYPLLGKPHESLPESISFEYPTYLGANYDASTTNLTYSITYNTASAPLNITVSFLSPITPTSTLRQSIPASYLTVYVESEATVNIYLDINGHWVSHDPASKITWQFETERASLETPPTLQRWTLQKENQLLLSEQRDRAEWGAVHLTGPADVQYQSGAASSVRRTFAARGSLTNVNDDGFRSIGDREPVFAFSKSFVPSRKSGITTDSVTFTIALIQDPVVQYASARGLTLMRPLWKSWFDSTESLLSFHYYDFANAASLASNYSTQLAEDAYQSGAQDYVDIVALSARQVMGATTFSGTPEDPILFLKEISSNGNFQTIDVIFPSFPFFLYTNPRWLAYLLEPLIEHMLSGQYPNKYAMHDLGTHFPNATGHPDGRDEYMPVEECGNILIMGLAIVNSMLYDNDSAASSIWSTQGEAMTVNDGVFPLSEFQTLSGIELQDGKWGGAATGRSQAEAWIQRSYRLWKQWTEYLIEYSLEPERQLSTDDFAGWLALQTNLALKGIIGINAMSKLAEIGGYSEDVAYYKNISDTYITKWEELGMSRDNTHAKLSYNWYGSWTTIYNLYADAQLCFHLENTPLDPSPPSFQQEDTEQTPLHPTKPSPKKETAGFVPHHIYTKQSNWYHAVRQKYGLPLDSRHLYTKTDWEFFAVAVASQHVRAEILESVAKWVNETSTDLPLTDLHETEGEGGFPGPNFYARPVIGGHFAFLALQRACGGKAVEGLRFLDEGDEGDSPFVSDGVAYDEGIVRQDL